jgi:hypothetical protein
VEGDFVNETMNVERVAVETPGANGEECPGW